MKTSFARRKANPPLIYIGEENLAVMRASGKRGIFVAVLQYTPAVVGAEHLNTHTTGEMVVCTELKPLEEKGGKA